MKRHCTFTIDEGTYYAAEHIANTFGLSRSAIVNMALDYFHQQFLMKQGFEDKNVLETMVNFYR